MNHVSGDIPLTKNRCRAYTSYVNSCLIAKCCAGVLNGPILRNLGFRKVAIAGGIMMFVGLFVTSFAYKFLVFFIFYGLINCEYQLLKLIVYSVRS